MKHQSRIEEVTESEKVTIYHHKLHQKHIKKTSILKLQDGDTLLEGHASCSRFLENSVSDLLLAPAELSHEAQETLPQDVDTVFMQEDNDMLCAPPSLGDVKEVLAKSNLQAAPGCDGITGLLYYVCWDFLGESLTEVMKSIHEGNQPTVSQRTSLMVFGSKPKKPNSIRPGDKRRISLLNADYKLATGLESRKFRKLSTHTLSQHQYVAGNNRRIPHGINLVRDAITAAEKNKLSCGILDTDYMAAFDYLVMHWVFKVLARKGVRDQVIQRLKNLYAENITVVVVNNSMGKAIMNVRWSLRQGDLPSMFWFAYAIDPLIIFLDNKLKSIPLYSIPLHDPAPEGLQSPLPHLEQRYRVVRYADDLKPSVTTKSSQLWIMLQKCLRRVLALNYTETQSQESVNSLP